ncbi:unnamed protein product [Microthlaspi erraticum]|uniref:Uncharacterized protein n=1 Tax=Microthlaspi erraticum TaxID=1685480 RepID=A0A6D2K952_9BRAS|nr:unnamed protein product [Microthlaspi erraticum]
MLKQAQAIYLKYRGRAFPIVAYHPLTLSWKEHRCGIKGALAGGYLVHFDKCYYQRAKQWYKVKRMEEGLLKRLEERLVITEQRYRAMLQLETDGKP